MKLDVDPHRGWLGFMVQPVEAEGSMDITVNVPRFFFIGEYLQQAYPEQYPDAGVWNLPQLQMLAGINPVIVLFGILGESIAQGDQIAFSPWLFFSSVYFVLGVLLVSWSSYLLKPVRRKWWSWKKRPVRVE
jgi:ABC-2 type transport system permease protein